MTKKELLQVFENAIEATEAHAPSSIESTGFEQSLKDKKERLSFLKQARRDIDNLLKIFDDATNFGDLFAFEQGEKIKSPELLLQSSPIEDVHDKVLKIQGSLERYVNDIKSNLWEKLQTAQNQSKSINLQQEQSAVAWRKHSKGSKWLWGVIGAFIIIVLVLLIVYYVTMKEFSKHAFVDFVLMAIGLGVDIFALIREILNDHKEQAAQEQIDFEYQKLFDNLIVSTTVNVVNHTTQSNTVNQGNNNGGSQVGVNYGTVNNTKK